MGVGGGGLGVGEYGASGDVCYLKIIRKYNTKANNTFFERKKIQNSMKRYNTTRDNTYMSKSTYVIRSSLTLKLRQSISVDVVGQHVDYGFAKESQEAHRWTRNRI